MVAFPCFEMGMFPYFNPNHLAEASRPCVWQRRGLLCLMPELADSVARAEPLAGLGRALGTEICQL